MTHPGFGGHVFDDRDDGLSYCVLCKQGEARLAETCPNPVRVTSPFQSKFLRGVSPLPDLLTSSHLIKVSANGLGYGLTNVLLLFAEEMGSRYPETRILSNIPTGHDFSLPQIEWVQSESELLENAVGIAIRGERSLILLKEVGSVNPMRVTTSHLRSVDALFSVLAKIEATVVVGTHDTAYQTLPNLTHFGFKRYSSIRLPGLGRMSVGETLYRDLPVARTPYETRAMTMFEWDVDRFHCAEKLEEIAETIRVGWSK